MAPTILNILAVIGGLSSVISIVLFFSKKPFKNRFLWIAISFAFCAVILFLLEQNQTNKTKEPVAQGVDSTHIPRVGDTGKETPRQPNKPPEQNRKAPISEVVPQAKEDFSVYVNPSASKKDIAVIVLDKNNVPLLSMASEIAGLYQQNGHTATTSLFTFEFFNSKYVQDVQYANSKILEKLELQSKADYLVFAKYSNEFESGDLTKWISRANLEVSIIDCSTKSLVTSFSLPRNNGFDDKRNAEEGAKEKIMLAYKTSHLNL
ncbi:MAG: hypothetical protein U0V75_00065 [Ferruginibacter sp.]